MRPVRIALYGDVNLNLIDGSAIWLASLAQTPALAADDPLRPWYERVCALYGGLGEHPGLFPIFRDLVRQAIPLEPRRPAFHSVAAA